MGFNDSYSAIRSQIVLMNPLPVVSKAYKPHSTRETMDFSCSTSPVLEGSLVGMGEQTNVTNASVNFSVATGNDSINKPPRDDFIVITVGAWVIQNSVVINYMVISIAW